jgi:uncharacterized repeat protein (TIGR03803 family)
MRNQSFYSTTKMFSLFCAVLLLACGAFASTANVIYSFAGDEDGEYIDSDLVADSAGNLFGTSVQGGTFGTGTVWELSPTTSGWVHTVLYSFTGGADGGQPYKGVALDADGNLYGTTVVGGSGGVCPEDGCGVVYKLTHGSSGWTQSVIYNFTGGKDGYEPGGGVTFDRQGNMYGTTPVGGAKGFGTIWELHPQATGNWQFRLVHTFTGGADGGTGSAGRFLIDKAGNLYNVATVGGAYGSGTAYELSPVAGGKWKFTLLYAFKGQPDAGFPYGGLSMDAKGNLYGTTYYDGANDLGSVYRLSRQGNAWRENVLYSFKGGSDGNNSISNLVFDSAGNMYGTTSEGGAGCSCGVIFKLSPAANGKWSENVAYRFQNTPDAAFAYNGMFVDSKGNMYGATVHGGTSGEGAVYQFMP